MSAKPKPVVPRARANRDIDEIIAYSLREGGGRAGLRFIGALDVAYRHIARHPASRLPRYGHELDMPGLRAWPIKQHPYLVFYVEREDRIDVKPAKRREHGPFSPSLLVGEGERTAPSNRGGA